MADSLRQHPHLAETGWESARSGADLVQMPNVTTAVFVYRLDCVGVGTRLGAGAHFLRQAPAVR